MIADDFVTAPVVVVGGGIAGLATALALKSCVVVADEAIGGGSSTLAQGGIAAALDEGDSPALHAADTIRVSAGIADPATAALIAEAAAGRIEWLQSLGVAFDRTLSGALELGREAGHCRHRIVHAGGDRTGASVMRAMRVAVRRRNDIRVLEGFGLLDLLTSNGRAAGVLLEDPGGLRLAVVAPQVVFATGGIGGCFDRTTNPRSSRGAGLAAAARCGVRLADLEFVQFHPTALAVDSDPLPLLTEALRGAGAVLLDESGDRFMTAIHPDAELAPRDVVARSVYTRTTVGRQVLMDASGIKDLATRFPGACALARDAGFDPVRQPLPVTTAAHFHMGGIATDTRGATSLPGLWACGEVASTGLHGGNRLASNSLLEGMVFGERIARAIRATALALPAGALVVPRSVRMAGYDADRVRSLRELIGGSMGPLRDGNVMATALHQLDAWQPASQTELNLIVVARELLYAALARRESLGSHQRRDFPGNPACCETGAGAPARSFQRPEPLPTETLELLRSDVA